MASFPRARAAFSASVVLACLATAACSLVLKAEGNQCDTDADCTARGASFAATRCVEEVCVDDPGAPGENGGAGGGSGGSAGGSGSGTSDDPRWACLGKVMPPAPRTEPVEVTFLVTNDSSLPIPHVEARVCTNLDINCLNPFESGLKTDADGIIRFQVPANFVGYVELADARYKTDGGGSAGASGGAGSGGAGGNPPQKLVPLLVVVDAVNGNIPDVSDPLTMVSYGLVEALASIFSEKFDETRATTLIAMFDCEGKRAADVTLEVDPAAAFPETTTFYTIGPPPGVPDPTVAFTDVNGTGGVLNMKPKVNAVVTSRRFDGGQRIGSATFPTRAGWISTVRIVPSP